MAEPQRAEVRGHLERLPGPWLLRVWAGRITWASSECSISAPTQPSWVRVCSLMRPPGALCTGSLRSVEPGTASCPSLASFRSPSGLKTGFAFRSPQRSNYHHMAGRFGNLARWPWGMDTPQPTLMFAISLPPSLLGTQAVSFSALCLSPARTTKATQGITATCLSALGPDSRKAYGGFPVHCVPSQEEPGWWGESHSGKHHWLVTCSTRIFSPF